MKKELFNLLLLAVIMLSCGGEGFENQAEKANEQAWKNIDTILARIKAPEFNSNEFLVTNYLKNEGRKC